MTYKNIKLIKIIKNFLILFYIFIFISLSVYIFSFYSISKKKVFDLFWINSIQKSLYWGGLIRSFPCYRYDSKIAYVPAEGFCRWKNLEFDTILTFTKYFRKNNNYEQISDDLPAIAVLGDSYSMGWGVNDNETFSAILEKKLNRKVYNFGVSGYGTYQEILRFIHSPYYKKINNIIIQYHINDLETNYAFERKSGIFSEKFIEKNFLKPKEFTSQERINFVLRHYKKSWRLLYRDIKNLFLKPNKVDFNDHEDKFLEILKKYNYFDDKKIIFFYINGYNSDFTNYYEKKFKNVNFVKINVNKKENYFIIDDHINQKGHKIIAEELEKIIKNINW